MSSELPYGNDERRDECNDETANLLNLLSLSIDIYCGAYSGEDPPLIHSEQRS